MSAAPHSHAELLERLAGGLAAGIVVVTPNRRLAQALQAAFDASQLARGLATWEAADILPFTAFLERLWDDALHADGGDRLPMLLSPAQEQHLWEEAIRGSERGRGLLAVPQAAEQCRAAWQLQHAWRIGPGRAGEDAEAFAEWSRAYLRRAGGDTDGARLPDVAAGLVEPGRWKALVAYAFDIVTPQARAFFEACAARGIAVSHCTPPAVAPTPVRLPMPGLREEIDAAARWARSRLESGVKRIGVVVPDLQLRRREVVRVFTRVLQPDRHVAGAAQGALPFNLSIGEPLAGYPLVHAALGLLQLAHGEVDFALASRLVRSPFLGGAESEMTRRALLDARLRRELPATLTLAKLVGATSRCPRLREHLEALYRLSRDGTASRTPHEWARHFSALLAAAGFPGERTLDSAEFQTVARWHETLAAFAGLERVAPRMGAGQALSRLRRLCADALFQPESPDAPVQVLGILESAGLQFDALWVSGLSDEAWPLAARPNPFIPIQLQKAAKVPEASAEGAIELDRRITAQWFGAAREVIVSHPVRDGDRELSPSPLVVQVPEGEVDIPAYPRYRDVLFAARRLAPVPDGAAPPLQEHRLRGGVRILADQAACPFRAFARHRLAADALDEPAPGLDAAARGTLLHDLMARLWRELKSSTALSADTGQAILAAAAGAVEAAGLDGRFAELERVRLAKLAREWLDVERGRGGFEVVAVEDPRELAIGGLAFRGRIDRLDRLPDGSHALIDYKTGAVTRSGWLGRRPTDPQLPLYAVTAAEPVGAIAFARLKTGDMKYSGYGRDGALVEKAKDWDGLLAAWRAELASLARGFAAGDAPVDPKQLAQTCRLCDLQPLCRVHEKLALGDEDGEASA